MTGTLSFSVSAWPSHALVTVAGECDITTAPQLLDALCQLAEADVGLVLVDLSALRHLDAAGIRALLNARGALAGRGKSLALTAPRRIVSRMLELTHTGDLVPVYASVAAALAADQHA